MINVAITTFNGNTKLFAFPTADHVHNYVKNLASVLPITMSVKVSCDLLGISGVIKGEHE
jgi:hypothetical protein